MRRFALLALAAAFLPAAVPTSALAQLADVTYVSSTGQNNNTCTAANSPCDTFDLAMSKTKPGGEIVCLNSGRFGAVTITKAITINCTGNSGTIVSGSSPSSTTGIIVNAGASDEVYLKGLDINGAAGITGSTSVAGIKFNTGKALTIEDSQIYGYQLGVDFSPTGASFLTIINSTLSGNGLPNVGGGLKISPTSTGYGVISMHNVRIVRNYIGIGGSTTGTAVGQILNSTIANNSSDAISVSGNITLRVGSSAIAGNGGRATAGNVFSFGDNQIVGNSPDTTPSVITQR